MAFAKLFASICTSKRAVRACGGFWLLAMLAWVLLPGSSLATPLPGSVISAQASATYRLASGIVPDAVYSNGVFAVVQPVEALTLTADMTLQRPAASTAMFSHVLTNVGNVSSTYTFSVDTSGCSSPNAAFVTRGLYLDLNNNGVVDTNDRQLNIGGAAALKLAPGEFASLLFLGSVPIAGDGAVVCQRLIATTDAGRISAQNTDRVVLTSNAALQLSKSVSYSGAPQAGVTVLTYTVRANNIGNGMASPDRLSSTPAPILVDGQPRALILIRDVVPTQLQYVAGTLQSNAAGAIRLFRLPGDAPFSYHSELPPINGIASGRDDVTAIEVAIGLPEGLPASGSMRMGFQARILPGANAAVFNQAIVHFNDGSGATESVSNVSAVKLVSAVLGLAKAAISAVPNVDSAGAPDGTATVRFQLLARNYGGAPLYNLSIKDLLPRAGNGLTRYTSASSPAPGEYTVVSNSLQVVSMTGAGTSASTVSDFTGLAGHEELLAPGAVLPAGGAITVQFDMRFNLTGLSDTLFNSANATASVDTGNVNVVRAGSVPGTDPDLARDGDPAAHAAPTPFSIRMPALNLVKTAGLPRVSTSETAAYDLDFSLKVTNVGTADAAGIRLMDNLNCAFDMDLPAGAVQSWRITSAPRSLNNLLTPSAAFTGNAPCDRSAQTNTDALASFPSANALALVDGARSLRPGESETIQFTVHIALKPSAVGTNAMISNKAWAGIAQPIANGTPTLLWGTAAATSTLLADPAGTVYNAVTRQPVAGARVTMSRLSCQSTAVSALAPAQLFGNMSIYTFNGDGSVSMTTDASGGYAFVFKVPPVNDLCTYGIRVEPMSGSGLVYPSTSIAAQPGVFNTCGAVSPASGAPQNGQSTAFYNQVVAGLNVATNTICEVINNNIPLDPVLGRGLTLQKTASTQTAELGDLLTYTLKVANQSNIGLPQVSIQDTLPHGFRLVPGSVRIAGVRAADPAGGVGPNLQFALPVSALAPLGIASSMTLSYQVRIGVSTPVGVDSVNRARATAGSGANAINSNEAAARVKVLGGVFANEAYAFGKVFMDCNKNGVQDDAEAGIAGVRLFMEDGTGVVTDQEGKWSLYGLRPVSHALRLDTATLPAGAELALIEPRQSAQADSVFMDLKNGEWHRANFAVQNCEADGLMEAVHARRTALIAQPALEGEAVRATNRLNPDGRALTPPTDVRGLPAAGTIESTGVMQGISTVSSPLISVGTGAAASSFPAKALDPMGGSPTPAAMSANPVTPRPDDAPVAAPDLEDILEGLDRKAEFLNLKDGQVLSTAVTNVRVKGSLDSRLSLTLNGEAVDEKRVGKRARVQGQTLEAWEYIAVQLRPGVNTLQLKEWDRFGIERGEAVVQVRAHGALARIAVEMPQTAKADERTPVSVTITLLDANGLLVTDRTLLTLESIAARWNVVDANALEAGVQTMVKGGIATLELMPPANPGDAKVRISAGTVQSESRIIFLPDLRPLTGIGMLEGVIQLRQGGNLPLGAPRASDAFESELRGWSNHSGDSDSTGRAAFYFKGAVKGEYLLTAAYDSDKTTAAPLFRDIQPDQFYPVYGDSSSKSFDAQSSQRLYVRIDKNRSFLLYGDFNTATSPEVRKLSQVSRPATGLQNVLNSEDARISSHYSRDALKQVVEEFAANGTSGPFVLQSAGGSDLFANSETVQVVVRDRNQPNVILSATPLTRFVDYSIEPVSRRILLTRPVSQLDADLNPQSLRISYVVDTGGPAFDVAGVDIQLRVSDRLQLGAVAEYDGAPQSQRTLTAATGLLRLDEKTVLKAEAVATQSDLKGQGQGFGLDLRRDDSLLKYNLTVQSTDAGFDNPSAAIASGHTEMRGHVDYQLSTDTHLKGDVVYTRDNGLVGATGNANAVQTQGVSAAVQTKVNTFVTAEVGLRAGQTDTSAATGFDYASVSSGAVPTTSPAASGNSRDTLAARARLTVQVPQATRAQVFVEAEQDLYDNNRHIAAVGGNYGLSDKTLLYGRYEVISSMGSEYALTNGVQRNVGLVGVESAYMPGGRIYDEYRIADTVNGRALQSAMGVRNTFEVSEGMKFSGGVEQVSAAPGSSGAAGGASTAVTTAFDWLGTGLYAGRVRGGGVVEWRDGADSNSTLVTLGVGLKLNADWSLLTRGTLNQVKSRADGSSHWLEREQIGFAYRPVAQDIWNALLRYEHKADSWEGVASATNPMLNTSTDILSAHLNYQYTRGDIWSVRLAAKHNATTSDGLRSSYDAQLLHGRWTHDISEKWDAGMQAGLLLGDGGTQQYTVGAEVGYQLSKGLWLSVGYNVLGLHEPDMAGADYTDSGFYVRMRFKFDERLFAAPLSPAAAPK